MTRRDTTTEAFEVLCDLTRTRTDAFLTAFYLLRRKNDNNAAFVVCTGLRFRETKAEQRFESDQLSRWGGEGGYEP